MQNKAFELYQVDNGVGVDAGYLLDDGIPVHAEILLYNEFVGMTRYVGLEFTASLKFNIEGTWDDYWIYPYFGSFEIINP